MKWTWKTIEKLLKFIEIIKFYVTLFESLTYKNPTCPIKRFLQAVKIIQKWFLFQRSI